MRFVLAVIVLVGFGIWFQQNKSDPALQEAADVAARRREIDVTSKDFIDTVKSAGKEKAQDAAAAVQKVAESTRGKTLDIPFLPQWACEMLSGWTAGLAGAILLVSATCHGRLLGITSLLAAGIALIGHWFTVPIIGPVPEWISAIAAIIVAPFGLIFFRKPEGY